MLIHMISTQGLYKHCIDGAFVLFFNAVWSYFCFLFFYFIPSTNSLDVQILNMNLLDLVGGGGGGGGGLDSGEKLLQH